MFYAIFFFYFVVLETVHKIQTNLSHTTDTVVRYEISATCATADAFRNEFAARVAIVSQRRIGRQDPYLPNF